MPYYKEYFVNRARPARFNATGSSLHIQEQALVTSFRTRPHPAALVSAQILNETTVDPYAYFLTSNARRDYEEALRLRGLALKGKEGRPDMGHPFELVKHTVVSPYYSFLWSSAQMQGTVFGYTGSGLDSVHNGSLGTLPSYGSDSLGTFAQQAYNRVAPTSVVFDAANFLGELREGLPRLALQTLKGSVGFFRGLGNDYLNVEFGWKPFIRDLQNAAKALHSASNMLALSGKRVHRAYGVPIETRSQEIQSGLGQYDIALTTGPRAFQSWFNTTDFKVPSTVLGLNPSGVTTTSTRFNKNLAIKSYSRRRWFEGSFTSFMPLGFDPTSYTDRLQALVNVNITPEVLWNLAPWTWLVDWNLRIGDTISANQTAANDLLIMHYGYAMEETIYKTVTHCSSPIGNGPGTQVPNSVLSSVTTVRKRRIRANPYGFRVGGAAALTGSQLAILAALGLTKSK